MKIVVTGGYGFIGSCLVSKLNCLGLNRLVLVDDFSFSDKNKNLKNKQYLKKIERSLFVDWFTENVQEIKSVYHIGARTDTAEPDTSVFDTLNLN